MISLTKLSKASILLAAMSEKDPRRKGNGEMSVRDAGKMGGEATNKKYGSKYYKKIGEKGGATNAQRQLERQRGRQRLQK